MLLFLVLGVILLGACAPASFDPVCPTYYPYSQAEFDAAAVELEAFPPGSVLISLLGDYAAVREEIRVCRAGTGPPGLSLSIPFAPP